jgi:ATPases involved in chromosome partitioning
MDNNKIVAVWGSPGSGATTTSIKVARELAKNNNVVLILTDEVTPSVPLVAPPSGETKSLGHLLTLPVMKSIPVFQHLIPAGRNLSLLGYQSEENEITYGEYKKERVQKLLSILSGTADYVVIDCYHHLLANVFTAVALAEAKTVLRITNADPKSLLYLKSQRPYLAEERFHYDRHVNIINNVLPSQPIRTYEDALGGKAYLLPHLDALKAQFDEVRLLDSLSGREAKQYEPVIRAIVKEVILVD